MLDNNGRKEEPAHICTLLETKTEQSRTGYTQSIVIRLAIVTRSGVDCHGFSPLPPAHFICVRLAHTQPTATHMAILRMYGTDFSECAGSTVRAYRREGSSELGLLLHEYISLLMAVEGGPYGLGSPACSYVSS